MENKGFYPHLNYWGACSGFPVESTPMNESRRRVLGHQRITDIFTIEKLFGEEKDFVWNERESRDECTVGRFLALSFFVHLSLWKSFFEYSKKRTVSLITLKRNIANGIIITGPNNIDNLTHPCLYKGALQSINSGIHVCVAEQVGFKSNFKRIDWIGCTKSSRKFVPASGASSWEGAVTKPSKSISNTSYPKRSRKSHQ